ncbi:MAG: hypothetical protein LBL65_05675 [Campylobacteraceae bacterium]|jgi:hypothetical protein|nr:hypothetical protein [Campylobacteraceae bacterium]
MSKLDFIQGVNLNDVRLLGKKEAIIDKFAYTRSINIIWAPSGSGKTEFMFGISKLFLEKGQEIVYIDVDNGLDILIERGYDTFIENARGKMKYINADMFDSAKDGIMEVIEKIRLEAKNDIYKNCVFVLDSLKFFLDGEMYDERRIYRLISFCKAIRRNGGMVWVINHATKKGDAMKGGQGLIDAVDECWQMKVLPESAQLFNYVIEPEKYRLGIDKIAKIGFAMNKTTYELTSLDVDIADMNESEKEFVEKVKNKLSDEKEGLSQNKLLESLELDKGDKAKITLLEKHAGRFWEVSVGKNRAKIYSLTTPIEAKSA